MEEWDIVFVPAGSRGKEARDGEKFLLGIAPPSNKPLVSCSDKILSAPLIGLL